MLFTLKIQTSITLVQYKWALHKYASGQYILNWSYIIRYVCFHPFLPLPVSVKIRVVSILRCVRSNVSEEPVVFYPKVWDSRFCINIGIYLTNHKRSCPRRSILKRLWLYSKLNESGPVEVQREKWNCNQDGEGCQGVNSPLKSAASHLGFTTKVWPGYSTFLTHWTIDIFRANNAD
jgi:hypothetical protein